MEVACLLLSSSVAAMMSTIDSVLLSFVSVITLDFIKPYKNMSDNTFLTIGKVLSVVVMVLCALVANLVKIDLSSLLILQNNVLVQLVPSYFCALFCENLHWQGFFFGLLGSWIILVILIATKVSLPIFPGLICLGFNILVVIVVQLYYNRVLKRSSHSVLYPVELLPTDEPAKHYWIWIVIVTLFVFAAPWYLPSGLQTPVVWGLPLWCLVSVILSLFISIFGSVVLRLYWSGKEMEYQHLDSD